MNITGVDFIALPTRDFAAAEDFYGGVLGLERSKSRCPQFFGGFSIT